MAMVETEKHGQVMVIRMNRPERLNALGAELRQGMAEAWCEFRDSDQLEVAVFTGTGRAFCAGEDMKESLKRGTPGSGAKKIPDPFMDGTLQKTRHWRDQRLRHGWRLHAGRAHRSAGGGVGRDF